MALFSIIFDSVVAPAPAPHPGDTLRLHRVRDSHLPAPPPHPRATRSPPSQRASQLRPSYRYISTTIFPVLPPVNSSRKASGMDSMP